MEEEKSGVHVDDFDFDHDQPPPAQLPGVLGCVATVLSHPGEEFLTHKFSFLGSFPPGQFPSRELF